MFMIKRSPSSNVRKTVKYQKIANVAIYSGNCFARSRNIIIRNLGILT